MTRVSEERLDEVVRSLRGFAQAYATDMFPELTPSERGYVGDKLISLISAGMGRHMSKFTTEAADLIEQLRSEASRVPEGWVVVPKEPTEAMLQAACDATFGPRPMTPAEAHRLGHAAMIAAAPLPASPDTQTQENDR